MLMTNDAKMRAIATVKKQFEDLLRSLPEEIANDLRDLFQLCAKAKSDGDDEAVETISQAIREILLPESLLVDVDAAFFDDDPDVRKRLKGYREKVGNEIRKRRELLGMTQAELAEKAGIPQSHVSRLECGKHIPTYVTINKVAKALGTRPSKLDPGFSDD